MLDHCCPAKIDRNPLMRTADVSYSFVSYSFASSVRDIDSVLATTARREYIHVGSTPASMLVKAAVTSTEPISSKLTGQQ